MDIILDIQGFAVQIALAIGALLSLWFFGGFAPARTRKRASNDLPLVPGIDMFNSFIA